MIHENCPECHTYLGLSEFDHCPECGAVFPGDDDEDDSWGPARATGTAARERRISTYADVSITITRESSACRRGLRRIRSECGHAVMGGASW